ncbi:MAG: DASS family sodium-coupled anion symporter [Opitutaceae bacterium]|nr:DASS family sodium-coupled anion symporter [Opitutaceae bacterium]
MEAKLPGDAGRRRAGWAAAGGVVSSVLAVLAAIGMGRTGASREIAFMTGIFVLAAGLWTTQSVPLFATALIVIVLEVVVLANPGGWPGLGFASGASPSYREIIGVAADPALMLFFGGFVLAAAAVKEGVDRVVSGWLLNPFGTQPSRVLLGVMMVTLTFGMWMSNTATAAMMLALLTPAIAGLPRGEPFRKALMLGVAFSANLSGLCTPIASPPNAVAVGFLQKAGISVGFLGWMAVAVPLALLSVGLAWVLLLRVFPPAVKELTLGSGHDRLEPRGVMVVMVFLATVLLWATDHWHGLPAAVSAMFPVIIFAASGIFGVKDLREINWDVLILVAGGIALGAGMLLTGFDRAVVQWLPKGEGEFFWLALLLGSAALVGTFMSNTAAANLFIPIGMAIAAGGAIAPAQAAVSVALVASLTMPLPVSTPPNAMAYSRGEFTLGEMLKVSLPLSLISILVVLLGGGLVMRLWGLIP